MRYAPKEWKSVAILMRDSTYSVLEALESGPKRWTDLKEAAGLTDGGLQKVLREMIVMGLVEEGLSGKGSGFKEKRYRLTDATKREQILDKAKELKISLEKISPKDNN